MRNEIEELIEAQSTTMSEYQIDKFVINDKMTNYRMLKQVLLELGTRYGGLEDLELDLEMEDLVFEGLNEDLCDLEDGSISFKMKLVEIKKQKIKLKTLKKTLSNYKYEINVFEANFDRLKEQGDPKTILADEKGEELYWINKFIKEAQIDIMTGGRIGKGILDAILMLDDSTQKLIVDSAISQATASNLYLSASENAYIKQISQDNGLIPALQLNELIKKK